MARAPSKIAEALVGLCLPPACREEVLGDLYERYRGRVTYFGDALSTVPLVIFSRVRRTADGPLVLMEAMLLYLSFLSAARFEDPLFLARPWGLPRLAIPTLMTIAGLMLADAWAAPGKYSRWQAVRAPLFGIAVALSSQAALAAKSTDLALPRWMLFFGASMALVLVCAVRMLFAPSGNRSKPSGLG
jgi:hypothetical protein